MDPCFCENDVLNSCTRTCDNGILLMLSSTTYSAILPSYSFKVRPAMCQESKFMAAWHDQGWVLVCEYIRVRSNESILQHLL